MTNRRKHRRGAAMIVLVLTCLLVVSALVGSMTHATLGARRVVRMEHQMRQTELLLDAGVLRATGQLKVDSEYSGESWQPATSLERFQGPHVAIRVTTAADEPRARLIEVTASLGAGADPNDPSDVAVTRRSHTFRIQFSNSSSAE